jgi:hypothetical protein
LKYSFSRTKEEKNASMQMPNQKNVILLNGVAKFGLACFLTYLSIDFLSFQFKRVAISVTRNVFEKRAKWSKNHPKLSPVKEKNIYLQ